MRPTPTHIDLPPRRSRPIDPLDLSVNPGMLRSMQQFEGVKVFSATKARDRAELGERVTDWLNETGLEPVQAEVLQSSDEEYHCLTLVVWYRHRDRD